MIKAPLTIDDYQRGHSAKVAIKGIRNRAPSKFTSHAYSLCVYILAFINQALEYTNHNFGKNVPTPATLLFCHDQDTIRQVLKCREYLKQMYAMLDRHQKAEMKHQFSVAMEYLKDLQAYLAVQMKRGIENA